MFFYLNTNKLETQLYKRYFYSLSFYVLIGDFASPENVIDNETQTPVNIFSSNLFFKITEIRVNISCQAFLHQYVCEIIRALSFNARD